MNKNAKATREYLNTFDYYKSETEICIVTSEIIIINE